MGDTEFQTRVIQDLTELKVIVARLDERVKPLQEARKDARNSFYSAIVAVGLLLLDLVLRR